MTSLKTSIKTITYLSDTGCLEIQGASLPGIPFIVIVRQILAFIWILPNVLPTSMPVFSQRALVQPHGLSPADGYYLFWLRLLKLMV